MGRITFKKGKDGNQTPDAEAAPEAESAPEATPAPAPSQPSVGVSGGVSPG